MSLRGSLSAIERRLKDAPPLPPPPPPPNEAVQRVIALIPTMTYEEQHWLGVALDGFPPGTPEPPPWLDPFLSRLGLPTADQLRQPPPAEAE